VRHSDGNLLDVTKVKTSLRVISRATHLTRGWITRIHIWWIMRTAQKGRMASDRGMSTAEYAVGTIAACAFAALLFKIVSSKEVQEMLTALVSRALNTTSTTK
jgi:hypothetical protein